MKLPDFLIIPSMLILDKKLTPKDREVYGIIYWYERLSLKKCILSNNSFAKLLNSSSGTIANSLSRLCKQGYIKVILDEKTNHRKEIKSLVFFNKENNIAPSLDNEAPSLDNEYNNIDNKKNNIYPILEKNKEIISSLFDDGKISPAEPDVFDWRWAMTKANSRTNLFFIGLFWKKKEFVFDNKEEAGAELVRLLRTSTKYAKKFSVEKFKDMLDWIEIDSRNKGNYEWGFDTLNKRLSIYNQEK